VSRVGDDICDFTQRSLTAHAAGLIEWRHKLEALRTYDEYEFSKNSRMTVYLQFLHLHRQANGRYAALTLLCSAGTDGLDL